MFYEEGNVYFRPQRHTQCVVVKNTECMFTRKFLRTPLSMMLDSRLLLLIDKSLHFCLCKGSCFTTALLD